MPVMSPGSRSGVNCTRLARDVQRLGKPLDQFRFAQSGQALQQDVAAGQNAGEDEFNEIFLAEQNLVHGGGQGVKLLHGSAEFFLRERGRSVHRVNPAAVEPWATAAGVVGF